MFLLDAADLLALLGLFVQAMTAWIYVALLRSLRRRSAGFATWERAFLAVAIGLTALSVRFFQAHDVHTAATWREGELLPGAAYGLYAGTKALFALLLVVGTHEFAGRTVPRPLLAARWPASLALGGIAFWLGDIHAVLLSLGPILVACALLALHTLRRMGPPEGTGARWVRWGLVGLAVTWTLHPLDVLGRRWSPVFDLLLSLNSFLDLVVQIVLGTGLIVAVLEELHRRARNTEALRVKLQREVDRSHKLRALGTLVSGVAHELNNPLTAILGFAPELVNPRVSLTAARVVLEQAERCRGIVRNLSSLAAQPEQPSEEIELGDLIERVVRGLQLRLEQARQVVDAPEVDPVWVLADAIGIEQVLSNLLVNAMQANLLARPDGPGRIAVRLTEHEREATLDVIDEGPGIPEERRAMVFEPFYTTKKAGQGIGLGLAVVHAIIEGHRGRVEILDAPEGRGTCFRIHLPRSDGETVDTRQRAAPARPAELPTLRLLVVDDEEPVRRVIRLRAEARGFRVRELDRAEPLLDPGIDPSFDVALCDLRMPGLGGIELHDRLAREAPERLRRLVFFTGDLASRESRAFAERCTRPVLRKPIDFDELFEVLVNARVEPRSG